MTRLPARLLDSPLDRTVASRWAAVRSTLNGPVVTRFAPSPTGVLHEGHLLHLAWIGELARLTGARVIVRMEDHDATRCRPEYERAILDELERSGLEVDHASLASLRSGAPSPYRQGDNPERYRAAFERLREMGLLYGCTCTRSALGPPDEFGERHYPGTCRGQPIDREGKHVVRLMLPDEATEVEDLLHGTIRQHPLRDHGDPVIRDALGQWTYQLCVVVDDTVHGVNLVIRGNDLVTSTGRQLLLARLLGRTEPIVTAHHPLLLDGEGKKISKRGVLSHES
jgi:glutamyl/glutaminyl-tRNA synthetase